MYRHWKPTLIALALAPALALANDPATPATKDGRTHQMHAGKHAVEPMSDQAFLDQAHESGRKEVLAARLAQDSAGSAQVRSLAETIERDHRNLNAQLEKAGASGKPTHPNDAAVGDQVARNVEAPSDTHPSVPPRELTDEYVRTQLQAFPKMRPLLEAKGADFDRKYVQMQVRMHEKSIAKFESVANGTRNSAEVKQLARQALPTLRQHLASAQALAGTLGPDPSPTGR